MKVFDMKRTLKSTLKFFCPYGIIELREKLSKKNTTLKQELLLRLALKEKGFDLKKLNISVDHARGLNYVNSIEMGIKYPDSFYKECSLLVTENKNLDFYFKGEMHDSGLRKEMLAPYVTKEKSLVIESNDGRIVDRKDKFDYEYFSGLASAKFGLCPDHVDRKTPANYLWGYRFIDSCFVGAIPILFVASPLSYGFVNGFHVCWHTKESDIDNFI